MRRFLCAVFLFSLASAGLLPAQQSMPPKKLYAWGMNALTSGRPRAYDKDAISDFHVAADQGYAPAQVMMGYAYEIGLVVEKNDAQAMDWYRKSAEQDNQLGEWILGRFYYTGTATNRDLNQAANWFQKAAAHGDPFGEYLMGMVDLDRKNYSEAAEMFRKAGQQGLPQAEQQLGLLFKNGQGVQQNTAEAYSWLLASSESGSKSAAGELPDLEAKLGNQLEAAKTKAHELAQAGAQAQSGRGCTGWEGEYDAVPTTPTPDLQMACQ